MVVLTIGRKPSFDREGKTMDPIETVLRDLYLEKKLSPTEIAKQMGLQFDQISYLRRKYKIPKVEKYERHNLVLSEKQKKIILGTVLGDGCLHKKDNYHRLLLEHCEEQKAYLDWKIEQLQCLFLAQPHFCDKISVFNKGTPKEQSVQTKSYAITSISHPVLTELANRIYDSERKKYMSRELLEYIGWEGLAVYYQDDGSAGENVLFHTCSFDLESLECFKQYLESQGVGSYISGSERNKLVTLKEADKQIFFEKITPYMIPSFTYKTISVRSDHTVWGENEVCAICKKTESKKVGKLCQRCYSEQYRTGRVVLEGLCYVKEELNDKLFESLRKDFRGKMVYYEDFNPFECSIKLEDYSVREIEFTEAESLISKFHYHRKVRRGDSLAIGLFLKERIVGVATYGRPVRDGIVASINKTCGTELEAKQVFELTRLVLIDGLPKCSATWFLSKSFKFIKELGKIRLLVAYSDTTQQHSGLVYRAGSWIHIGTTYPNYHYRNSKNELVTRSQAARLAKEVGRDENTYAAEIGLIPELEKFKHKFVYPIDKELRKPLVLSLAVEKTRHIENSEDSLENDQLS